MRSNRIIYRCVTLMWQSNGMKYMRGRKVEKSYEYTSHHRITPDHLVSDSRLECRFADLVGDESTPGALGKVCRRRWCASAAQTSAAFPVGTWPQWRRAADRGHITLAAGLPG